MHHINYTIERPLVKVNRRTSEALFEAQQSDVDVGYPRHQVTWQEVDSGLYNLFAQYMTDETTTVWSVIITPAWRAESSYTLPDLSNLEAWKPEWNVDVSDVYDTYIGFGAAFGDTTELLNSYLLGSHTDEVEQYVIQVVHME